MTSPYRTSSESPPTTKQVKSDNITVRIHYLNEHGEPAFRERTWKGEAYSNGYGQMQGDGGRSSFYYWRQHGDKFRQVDNEGKLFVNVDRITTIEVLSTEDVMLSVEVPAEKP